MKVFFLLIALSFTAQASQTPNSHKLPGEWVNLRTALFSFPFGKSVSPTFFFKEPLTTPKLAFEYRGDFCSHVSTQFIEVGYVGAIHSDRVEPNELGIFELVGPIETIKIYNIQDKYTSVACTETILGQVKPELPLQEFQYQGTITIKGSSQSVSVAVKNELKVTHFWLEVPAFCQDLAVFEAGTTTEGFYDRAELIDEKSLIFEVEGAVGVRISAIRIDARMPDESSCPINVYVKTK